MARLIHPEISLSGKIAKLSPEALALFCLIIPHLSSHGKMIGQPFVVKGQVAPLIPWMDIQTIVKCLREIDESTNVKWYRSGKLLWLHSVNWEEHQKLRRAGHDAMPDYPGDGPVTEQDLSCLGVAPNPTTPALVPDYSRTTPGVVRAEVKGSDVLKGKDVTKGCSEAPLSPPGGVVENKQVKTIIDHLNVKTGKAYKYTTPKTRHLINARMSEGFTVEDFITAIDNQAAEWFNDPKWGKFLRPDTLFSTKFESYLNNTPSRLKNLPEKFIKTMQAGAEWLEESKAKETQNAIEGTVFEGTRKVIPALRARTGEGSS